MTKTKLSMAIAAALLQGASLSASAYVPTNPTDSLYNIYFGGASASNLTLRQTIIEQMCDSSAGAISTFTVGSHTNPTQWAVACTVTSTKVSGITNTPAKVIFHKTNQGGSGTGVNPVEQETTLPYMIVSTTTGYVDRDGQTNATANCATSGTGYTTPAPTSQAYTDYACTGGQTEAVVPDGGTSDLEPSKFFGINTPSGSDPFKNLGNLNVYSVAHLVFGIAVTKDLRDSLQRVVFPTSSVCHPLNASYGSGVGSNGESEACMVNLTTDEIRSLLGGQISSWANVRITPAGSSTPTSLTAAVTSAGGTLPTDTNVQICRRVQGSGTQAQANAIFMRWPCDTDSDGNITIRQPVASSAAFGGPKVVLNSGSGDVRKCLNDYNDGTATMSNPVKPDSAATKRWAIGIQSLENNMSLADKYRFVKIDNYAPTLKNVHSGNYSDWAAQSIQWRNNPATFEFPVYGADIDKIFNFLKDSWITVASIVNLNAGHVHSFGASGWLLEPKAGSGAPDADFDPTKPINAYTRAPGSQSPNTCQAPIMSTFKNTLTVGD